jgi:putative peptide zinc metalloprotease protein
MFPNRVLMVTPHDEMITDGWLAEPVCLRPEVEVLVGADDQRMLFIPGPRRYLRLTPGGVRLLPLLDGRATGTELVDRVSERTGRHAPAAGVEAGRSVARLLDQLRRAGALTADPEPARRPSRFQRRVPLTRSVHRIVRRPAALLRRIPPRLAAGAVLLVTVLALGLAVTALIRSGGLAAPGRVPLALLLLVLPVQLLLHEGAHALLCEVLGVPAREVGVILWGYLLPVAYVDCTDSYRLRSRRSRAAIALAGPFVDVVALGSSAAGWLYTGAPAAHGLLLVQLAVLVTTVDPLLPGDGHHAIEALTGGFDVRRRGFTVLTYPLLRRPLPPGRRVWYLAYALLVLAWFVASVALVAAIAWALV